MSISNNALIFYHTYTIESKKKSVYFTDFSIKTSFSLEYRDGFERLLGWDQWPGKEMLMETMAESAKAVCDYFGKKIVFINVLRRMSVDCDCAGTSAAEPTIPDIGILASTDILAIDQASVDLVYGRPAAEKHDLVERIESRRGLHQLTAMKALGMGNDQYDLITVP